MARKPKSPSGDPMAVHITFRVTPELHDHLKEGATAHKIPLGEEIRRRLEASLKTTLGDLRTQKLLAAIATIASLMALDGNWLDDKRLFHVFKVAVLTLLSRFEPAGTSPDLPYLMSSPDDPPETVGRMYAGFAWRAVMNEKE